MPTHQHSDKKQPTDLPRTYKERVIFGLAGGKKRTTQPQTTTDTHKKTPKDNASARNLGSSAWGAAQRGCCEGVAPTPPGPSYQ